MGGLGLRNFNAALNKISVILCLSVLLVEETGVGTQKTINLPQVNDKLYHIIMLYQVHLTRAGFKLTTLVVLGTDSIDSCKSNYHTITTTLTPKILLLFY